jgi:hypothetical protein
MLLNIGFNYALKQKCHYVVFHDIDMLPIDVDYSYSEHPVHLATGFDDDREIFDKYFGGVTLFPTNCFKQIDGYSNKYWGWGFEDTDLLARCVHHDIDMDIKEMKNMGGYNSSLKFNGHNAYVKGINNFNLKNNITFFISFYPDEIICNHEKDSDEYNVFTIPGYDFSISYNSFMRYNFCTFSKDKTPLYINSNISTNYKTNICVVIDNTNKVIKLHQDGIKIGEINDYDYLYNYTKEPFFYLGVSNPNDENQPKFFKGNIDSFAVYNDILEESEIIEISNNEYKGLTQNFNDYQSADKLSLYYDTKFIKGYKLIDLSGNGNNGEIYNCEITDLKFEKYFQFSIPYRRKSKFKSLKHEENGFFENKWRHQCTRWNQLRFINEVSKNPELFKNDGLSTLEYVEYGVEKDNKITTINVGI